MITWILKLPTIIINYILNFVTSVYYTFISMPKIQQWGLVFFNKFIKSSQGHIGDPTTQPKSAFKL